MPNCDWYGTVEDNRPILDFIFSERKCEVYENASDYEKPLKRFHSTNEVIDEFNRTYPNGNKWHSVFLQLYVIGSGPGFSARRIELRPDKCGGATHRFSADGWGLVQFYLHRESDSHLEASHSNHNSQKRAEKWAPTCKDMEDPSAWDFDKIKSFSSQLNRFIRKNHAAKLGSRAVLPEALKLWNEGFRLSPYEPDLHSGTLKTKKV